MKSDFEKNNKFDAQAFIFDQRAPSFDKLTWVTDRDFLGIILARILEFVGDYQRRGRSVQRYLDAGTGTGEILKYFLERYTDEQGILLDAEAVGIDVSEEMLRVASEKLRNNPRVKLLKASITDHDLKYDSFDFALCRNSFHHFSDPAKAILEMRKLVRREGGKIFIIEGVAPDNYTLSKWKDILLDRDVGRNPEILLSMENVGEFFSSKFEFQPERVVELTPIPMLLGNWLDNAIITADMRRDVIVRTERLYKNDEFREKFGLERIRKEPEFEKEFRFKKRSVLLEFPV